MHVSLIVVNIDDAMKLSIITTLFNSSTYLETFLNEAKYLFLNGCENYQFEIKKYSYYDEPLGPPGTLEWEIANDEYDN